MPECPFCGSYNLQCRDVKFKHTWEQTGWLIKPDGENPGIPQERIIKTEVFDIWRCKDCNKGFKIKNEV